MRISILKKDREYHIQKLNHMEEELQGKREYIAFLFEKMRNTTNPQEKTKFFADITRERLEKEELERDIKNQRILPIRISKAIEKIDSAMIKNDMIRQIRRSLAGIRIDSKSLLMNEKIKGLQTKFSKTELA